MLVKVDMFYFPKDLMILDLEVDYEVPIGRPFLAIGRALVDVERGELKFRINNEYVKINIVGP